jgi:hypothetical protein
MVDTDLSSLFYFEFTLTDAGLTGYPPPSPPLPPLPAPLTQRVRFRACAACAVGRGNAIGFYPADEPLSGAPGWFHNSYGYHADEGCRYFRTRPLPPPCVSFPRY